MYFRGICYYWLMLAVAILAACGGRKTDEPVAGFAEQRAYFPLQIGKFIVYEVDSVVYDQRAGGVFRDSSRTFLRELVADTLRDNSGRLIFLIERSERRSDTAAWQLKNAWSAACTADQAIRTEDNLRFLRLIFPLDERSRWDGNRWIDPGTELLVAGESIRPFANWQYQIDLLDRPLAVGSFSFDSVLTVTETDQSNLYERRYSQSVYAKHLGMVYREQWFLDSQYCNQIPAPVDCATKPWADKAEKGFIVKMIVTDFN